MKVQNMTNETTLLEAIKSYGNWCAIRREALTKWVEYNGSDLTEINHLQAHFDFMTQISEDHFSKLAERLNKV